MRGFTGIIECFPEKASQLRHMLGTFSFISRCVHGHASAHQAWMSCAGGSRKLKLGKSGAAPFSLAAHSLSCCQHSRVDLCPQGPRLGRCGEDIIWALWDGYIAMHGELAAGQPAWAIWASAILLCLAGCRAQLFAHLVDIFYTKASKFCEGLWYWLSCQRELLGKVL